MSVHKALPKGPPQIALPRRNVFITCEFCDMEFMLESNLKSHLQTAHKACPMCGLVFVGRAERTEHIRTHHPTQPKTSIANFECNICSKMLTTKHRLEKHIELHKTKKPFSCIYCNKEFSKLASLKGHMWRHGKKLYSHLVHTKDIDYLYANSDDAELPNDDESKMTDQTTEDEHD